MTSKVRRTMLWAAFVLGVVVIVLGWVLYFENDIVRSWLPKWGWVQNSAAWMGRKTPADVGEDEEQDTSKNEIPVHTGHVSVATLHRYVEGFGLIAPRPAHLDGPAGAANIAAPVAGVVARILCEVGKPVKAGDGLIQLDDRLAKSAVDQAEAGLKQEEASLAALKATPRPDQLAIAELAAQKAQGAMELSQKNFDRVKQLTDEQIAPAKNLEQAVQDLSSAKNDLLVAHKQLEVVKRGPTAEELGQQEAKVTQAKASLNAAKIQLQMLTITAPIGATVVSVSVNPGEAVDTTRNLVSLIAMDRLQADLDVPADALPANAVGLAAQILFTPAKGGAAVQDSDILTAKVTYVASQVDPKTGGVQLGIDLPADARLRPGLSVRVRIIAEQHDNVLAVPRDAVVADENGDPVIAVVEGDQATHKHVKAGLEENGLVEIEADGLKEGDTVVTAGAFGLPQATRVKILD